MENTERKYQSCKHFDPLPREFVISYNRSAIYNMNNCIIHLICELQRKLKARVSVFSTICRDTNVVICLKPTHEYTGKVILAINVVLFKLNVNMILYQIRDVKPRHSFVFLQEQHLYGFPPRLLSEPPTLAFAQNILIISKRAGGKDSSLSKNLLPNRRSSLKYL